MGQWFVRHLLYEELPFKQILVSQQQQQKLNPVPWNGEKKKKNGK